jgi:hypothetical protein
MRENKVYTKKKRTKKNLSSVSAQIDNKRIQYLIENTITFLLVPAGKNCKNLNYNYVKNVIQRTC